MTSPKTRRAKRVIATAGVAVLAGLGGVALAATDSADNPALGVPGPPPQQQTHSDETSTRYDGGPEEGTRGTRQVAPSQCHQLHGPAVC
jgi:hypothetical protein